MDEDALFAEAMSKVKPIAAKQKTVQPGKMTGKPVIRVVQKRLPETAGGALRHGTLPQRTDDPWVLRADGVSRERLKRLAAGDPAVSETVDLHGLSRDQAVDMLDHTLMQALIRKQRVIAVVHGRGLHSQGKAVLKAAVYQWLCEGSIARHVLAVVPQPGSGGGACIVLLRRHA